MLQSNKAFYNWWVKATFALAVFLFSGYASQSATTRLEAAKTELITSTKSSSKKSVSLQHSFPGEKFVSHQKYWPDAGFTLSDYARELATLFKRLEILPPASQKIYLTTTYPTHPSDEADACNPQG